MVEKSHSAGMWPSFYEPLRQWGTRMAEWLSPASDAKGNDTAYTITMELPGVAEDDVDISVHDDVLTVRGEKSAEREDEGDSWFFAERQYGAFSRTFRLPGDADKDNVAARMKNGVLTLSIPKRSPQATGARKITIGKG